MTNPSIRSGVERLSRWAESMTINLQHFGTARELREWFMTHSVAASSAKYLLDFELIGEPETGITMIEALGLQDRAIIVSSRYDESGCVKPVPNVFDWYRRACAFVPISVVGPMRLQRF